MATESMNARVERLPANQSGRDFVVGDVHGHCDLVNQLLHVVAFDPARDRLFLVGDLVDRGPCSLEVLSFLDESWCHSVMGNHERFLIEFFEQPTPRFVTFLDMIGAGWFLDLHQEDRAYAERIVVNLQRLPHVIVVGEGEDRFNIVHAELRVQDSVETMISDADIDRGFSPLPTDVGSAQKLVMGLTQGYDLGSLARRQALALRYERDPESAQAFVENDENPRYNPGLPADAVGISTTFVGHSMVCDPIRVLSHHFIDTGAYRLKEGGRLTMVDVCTGETWEAR